MDVTKGTTTGIEMVEAVATMRRVLEWILAATVVAVGPGSALAQSPPPEAGPFRRVPAPSMGEDGGSRSSPPPPETLWEVPTPPGPGALYLQQQPGNALLVTEHLGKAVYGPESRKVGVISNLVVEITGRVVGVVIDVGGFLGFGAKEVAIPFRALYPVMEDGKEAFLVEMSKDQLAAAPAFKRSPP